MLQYPSFDEEYPKRNFHRVKVIRLNDCVICVLFDFRSIFHLYTWTSTTFYFIRFALTYSVAGNISQMCSSYYSGTV